MHPLKRHAPIIIGLTLSVLVHAIVIWLMIEHAPDPVQDKLLGNSDRMTITLMSPKPVEIPQSQPLPSEANEVVEKFVERKQKTAKPAKVPIPKAEPVVPPVVTQAKPEGLKPPPAMRPPPADELASMLEEKRKRRAEAQAKQRDSVPVPNDEQQKNNIVNANVAASLGQAKGIDNTSGGAIEVRHYDRESGEIVMKMWSPALGRYFIQDIQVSKNDELDIQTAMVKRMIQLMRENFRRDFTYNLTRQHRKIVIPYQPGQDTELRQALMKEFFPNYVPVPE